MILYLGSYIRNYQTNSGGSELGNFVGPLVFVLFVGGVLLYAYFKFGRKKK